MFGIDAVELVLIVVLAIVMFGPERIPEYSRKAARVVVAIRDMANNAQTQLRDELGPEYSDLNIADLNPKTFVKKHLSNEIALLEEAKADLKSAGKEIKDASTEVTAATADAKAAIRGEAYPSGKAPELVGLRFDLEAT